jgi:uncharacterized protein (TIGR02246 family)
MSANLSSHATEEETIKSVLSAYENALNASNTEAVMSLYTEDVVFMPPNNQSAVGKAAVRQAYNAVFKAITLNVKFTIAELVTMSPEWAFVRTNSAGTNKINATRSGGYRGQSGAVHLQEGRGRKVADRPLQLLHHYSAVLMTGKRKCERHGRVSHNG